MEDINSFANGLNKDSSDKNIPEHSLTDAWNITQLSKTGQLTSITNEEGTLLLNTIFPSGFSVIGKTTIAEDVIVVLANDLGHSQIGIIDSNYIYTRVVPDNDANGELGFTIDHPVQCIARKLFTGDRILYFTDNNVPFGRINLDNPPPTGEIADNVKLIPDLSVPVIDYLTTLETSGSLFSGVYQFVTQYKYESGVYSSAGIPCNPIPTIDEFRAVGRNKFDGAEQGTPVNKTIRLGIQKIDTSFKTLRVIAIYFYGPTNTLRAFYLPDVPINSETLIYDFSGIPEGAVELTLEELRKTNISYETAKTITQKDNRLFLGNLSESGMLLDEAFQLLANNIEVGYKIEEQEVSANNYISLPFRFQAAYFDTVLTEVFAVCTKLPSIEGNPLSRYILRDFGASATATITITSYADLFDGVLSDVISLNGVNFEAKSTAITGSTDFAIGTSNTEAAINLASQINAYAGLSMLQASATGNVVTVIVIDAGVLGNSFPLSYTNNTGVVAASVTPFAGGIDKNEYNPIIVDAVSETTIKLTFAINIAEGWTLEFDNVETPAGEVTSGVEFIENGEVIINDIPVSNNGITDYKDEYNTVYKKGYRRSEVYSFGIAGILKDGGESFAYHISGNDKTTLLTTPAIPTTVGPGNSYGICGTYVSTIDYPRNQNYPGNILGYDQSVGAVNTKIRHHKMPSLSQEPHYRVDNGKLIIRILSVKFKFNVPVPTVLRDRLQSFLFVRQTRNELGNTSVYTQGLATPMFETINYDYTQFDSNGPQPDPVLKSTGTTTGLQINTPPDDDLFGFPSVQLAQTPVLNAVSFMSPEILFNFYGEQTLLNKKMKSALLLTSDNLDYATKVSRVTIKGGVLQTQLYKNARYAKYHISQNFSAFSPLSTSPQEYNIEESVRISAGETKKTVDLNKSIDGTYSDGYNFLKLNSNFVSGVSSQNTYTFDAFIDFTQNKSDDSRENDDTFTIAPLQDYLLHSIEEENTIQYNSISSSSFIIVDRQNVVDFNSGDEVEDVFGGDTFINRFFYTKKDVFLYVPFYKEGLFVSFRSRGSGFDGTIPDAGGMDIRSLTSVVVESNINLEYRHQFVGGVPYYPKSDIKSVFDIDPRNGNSSSYNKQYSFENQIKQYFTKPSDFKTVNNFGTRIIYSETSAEDALVDNYQNLLVNNVHDISKNTGDIWNLFVYGNTLYAHTPKSLWKTFVNENTMIPANDLSEIVLGTAGVFSRPSVELITTDGGYAGTISQFGGTVTPFGYVFPDALQGKVFVLGSNLEEISKINMISFFNDRLKSGLVLPSSYVDNPYTGQGLHGVYDFYKKRFILSKKGQDAFTISFSQLSQKWLSFHSYFPDAMIQLNNEVYFMKVIDNNLTMYLHNKGERGMFFGEKFNSSLSFISAKGYAQNKTYNNIVINSDAYLNEVHTPLTGFDQLRVSSKNKNTGWYDLLNTKSFNPQPTSTQVVAKRVNQEWRIAIPKNNVIDVTLDKFDDTNIYSPIGTGILRPQFRDKMKDQFITLDFVYNNTDDSELVVNFINVIFEINPR